MPLTGQFRPRTDDEEGAETAQLPGRVTEVRMPKISLNKVEVAERQLRTAIRLFFSDGDPVPIHTLVAAAGQVTADLIEKKTGHSIIRSGSFIREEKRREVFKTIYAPENFFKHAERDTDGVIEFNPDATEFFLFAALAELQALTGQLPKEGPVFQMWFLLKHDDVLLENEATRPIREALGAVRKNGMAKADFLPFL